MQDDRQSTDWRDHAAYRDIDPELFCGWVYSACGRWMLADSLAGHRGLLRRQDAA